MRISSTLFNRSAIQNLMKQQVEIADLQSKIGSGKRLDKPSDGPIDSARKIDIESSLSQISQYIRNINFAEASLSNQELHLANSENILLRVRELALITNNSTTSIKDYPVIRAELEQLRADLLSQANAKDGNGNFIFAGAKTSTRPINPESSNLYDGDDSQRLVQVNQNQQIAMADSGKEIFLRVPQSNVSHTILSSASNSGSAIGIVSGIATGAHADASQYSIQFNSPTTYDIINIDTGLTEVTGGVFDGSQVIEHAGLRLELSGTPATNDQFGLIPVQNQDVFTTLDSFIALLDNPPTTAAEKALQQQNVSNTLGYVDRAFEHLLQKRAETGSRLASLDSLRKDNESSEHQLKVTLSGIEDLDYVDAISFLEQHATALEALQKTITRTQSLSLFNI